MDLTFNNSVIGRSFEAGIWYDLSSSILVELSTSHMSGLVLANGDDAVIGGFRTSLGLGYRF